MNRLRQVLVTLLAGSSILAAPPTGQAPPTHRVLDLNTLIDGNNLACFLLNEGHFAYDVANLRGRNDGLYYPNDWPADNRTVVYGAGLWLAGITTSGDTLVTVAEYSSEFRPGALGSDPESEAWRVYSVTQDSSTWSEWPLDQGAPLAADGERPWIADRPELTQMHFAVFNDGDVSQHGNVAGSTSPLGMEARVTGWCSAEPGDEREFWLRWELLNLGGRDFTRFWAAVWVDPDLGGAADDLAGCDPQRALAYCYNATDSDMSYGATPPAVGLVLAAGLHEPAPGDSAWYGNAWHAGERNLPPASISAFRNGQDPVSFRQSLCYMMGLTRTGEPRPGGPFDFSGDPVTGEGELDTVPGDKRLMLACGPVTLAPGQSQELSVAIAVGQGGDRLASITDLRQIAPWPYEANTGVAEPWGPPRPRALTITGVQPNPFNPTTTVSFRLARPASHLRWRLYDLLGQVVREDELGAQAAGEHRWVLRGEELSSGLYLLSLEGDGVRETTRVLLLK